MAYIAVGLAAVSVVSSILGSNAAAKEKEKQIKAQREAAKYKYAATESSVNIMKAISRESSINAITEVQRVGAENSRNIKSAILTEQSKVLASSEGLTSGRSKGRQMISGYIAGNKVLANSKNQTESTINKITTEQDAYTNTLNNELIGAHQDMAAILASEGGTINGTSAAINAGISGYSVGASIGASSASSANAYSGFTSASPSTGTSTSSGLYLG